MEARFDTPDGIAVDATGAFYVADQGNATIRRIAANGDVTTLAGSVNEQGTADGTGSAARFSRPKGGCVDAAGNYYFCDLDNHTIRRVTPAGVVTTYAGSPGQSGTLDGTGTGARFQNPADVAIDGNGNLFVADGSNHTIRKIAPGGVVTTYAGSPGQVGSTDATGTAARFNQVRGVGVDAAGNVYVASSNNIRVIDIGQAVTTYAGATNGASGTTDATGTAARFNTPTDVEVGPDGTLYVADFNNDLIRKITTGAVVTTLAGPSEFFRPSKLTVDSASNVYVCITQNDEVKKITPGGAVTTFAGSREIRGSTDGTGTAARFNNVASLVCDSQDNLYVADWSAHIIRKVTPAGEVTTFAGTASTSGNLDGVGPAARFSNPFGVAVDASDNIYVADSGNHTIRMITPGGVVSTLAGLAGSSGTADGTGNTARFSSPRGVAVDTSGNVYVADSSNHAIRMVTPGGDVTTVAGLKGTTGSIDGTGTLGRFNSPYGIEREPTGNFVVADTSNNTLRRVTPAGVVTTIAGLAGSSGTADGTGNTARFTFPYDLAVDAAGTIFVAGDTYTVRRVSPTGEVVTIGGRPLIAGSQGGVGAQALFSFPAGVALASDGTLLIGNRSNIVQGEPGPVPVATTAAATGLAQNEATLQGIVNPNGAATSGRFAYGTDPGLAGATLTAEVALGSGTSAVSLETEIMGLLADTTYYFRAQATNGAGTGTGSILSFTTLAAPTVVLATSEGATGAGLPAGTTFVSFTAPDVGVFGGRVSTPAGQRLDAVFDETGTVLLRGQQMVEVDLAGGADMGMIARLNAPTGDAVLATLDRRSGATAENDQVLFVGLNEGAPEPMVRKGQEVPGLPGVRLKSFLTLDGNGDTTFFSGKLAGAGVNGSNSTAIFAASPTVGFKMMVRKGQMVDGKQVKIIATLVGTAGTLAEGRWRGGPDDLGVRLTFTDKSHALYLIPASATEAQDWLRLGQTGDGAGTDLPGALLKSFMLPAHAPGATVFDSLLQTGPGAITRRNNRAVFDAQGVETRGPISLRLLAQTAGPAPAQTNIQRFLNTLAGAGRASTVIANSSLQGQRASRTTIFDARQDGALDLIARIGDAAPGGGRWDRFVSVAKPDGQGYGAFVSALLKIDRGAGVTAQNRAALFARGTSGDMQRILRAGDQLESAGPGSALKPVRSFVALAAAPGSIGAARGYSDDGRVNVLVTFSDRTQAVVSIQVP